MPIDLKRIELLEQKQQLEQQLTELRKSGKDTTQLRSQYYQFLTDNELGEEIPAEEVYESD